MLSCGFTLSEILNEVAKFTEEALRDYISTLTNIKEVNLLPYHNIGKEKYNRIGQKYKGLVS